jgi:hypothetical protein
MTQVVECLPCKGKALSLIPSPTKNKNKKRTFPHTKSKWYIIQINIQACGILVNLKKENPPKFFDEWQWEKSFF